MSLTTATIKKEITECKDKLAWLEKKLEETVVSIPGHIYIPINVLYRHDKHICVHTDEGLRLVSLIDGETWCDVSTFGLQKAQGFEDLGTYDKVFGFTGIMPTVAIPGHLYLLENASSNFVGRTYVCGKHRGQLRLYDTSTGEIWSLSSTFGASESSTSFKDITTKS